MLSLLDDEEDDDDDDDDEESSDDDDSDEAPPGERNFIASQQRGFCCESKSKTMSAGWAHPPVIPVSHVQVAGFYNEMSSAAQMNFAYSALLYCK